MYKHILVPVDGSKFSLKAVKTAAALAKASDAKLTLFYAARNAGGVYFGESPLSASYSAADGRAEATRRAEQVLEEAEKAVGAQVEKKHAFSEFPYDAITAAAAKQKCDLIVMASHGRSGVKGLILGSETQKVLTHTQLPVLVVH